MTDNLKPEQVTSIWDNGGKTADRYTVVLKPDPSPPHTPYVPMLALGDDVATPLGFSQWTEGTPGPHLGRKIQWSELPDSHQRHIAQRLLATSTTVSFHASKDSER